MKVDHRAIAKQLIEKRNKLSVDDYVELAEAFNGAGGQMVQASFDDDWCGTGRIPWPPRNTDKLLEAIGKLGGRGVIIIDGIPNPDWLQVVVRADLGR